MKLCSICKKNVAVMLTTKIENGKTEITGICMECAKKMGLPVIDQLIGQMNMKPEEIENITNQMNSILQNMEDGDFENIESENPFLSILKDIVPDKKEEYEPKAKSIDSEIKEKDSSAKAEKKPSRKKKKYLDTYGTNLTDKAMDKQIDKIIGRNREIDRVIQILNRRTKNNPVLIGEPGVGKTAIAEGLAVKIVDKQVPAKLFDAEIYLLDLTAIVAGTQFRGQFEGRMKAIIDEAKEFGNIILVIDEIHNIMGAGEVHGGVMNAANILKPSLANGEIQVIGTTTLEEYRKHIEKDSALERRFQPVLVEEPTIDEAIEILKGIKGYYEDYHKVQIPDDVIDTAVRLSERYISDRFLPDKAIDVIDEAGSRVNLRNQGFVELEVLKEDLKKVQELKEAAANSDNYEKAAEYKMEEYRIEDKIKKIEKECCEIQVTFDDIAYVIEAWTKIPVQRITKEEAAKLLSLEDILHKRVVGQHEAIVSLSKAIRRNRSGFRKKKKPASFIFVGPTGVGKTELAKALACELFGSEEAMIRIDMSEFMEKHTVSKLIGAPPGYIGYDEGGQLTEKVRRKPYSVILLDEIEKAHPDVFNMLLQILEDGRLTDSQGRTVFFENTVIIMTSNAGTSFNTSTFGFAGDGYVALESRVNDALKQAFRPEFLNRVDETIVFTHLSNEELRQIVDLMLKEVVGDVEEKGFNLYVSDEAKDLLVKKGYDQKYGARPLRRAIQRYIEDEIAELYLKDKFKDGYTINIDVEDDKIVVK
ncbi:ATPase family associated with various cellular activities (AAA) [Proteiniborus ethanoligenes]|uniref:ATPase family associated with various cellular activities (AAA) n=1 Tax=Proteiniborus ethanoligenes TaxID=415015 RepID=A0A1H3RA26_9FIRM|nr:ATP-dependent Clp protease ATP-binding subunit [Proteiniborus ethanoligenes]SDZ22486.1 ATPase family associated with various cellular activities (AAA) [Proteiniborus ethanoligenes]